MQNNNFSHNMYAYMGKEITIFPEDYLVGRTNLLTNHKYHLRVCSNMS